MNASALVGAAALLSAALSVGCADEPDCLVADGITLIGEHKVAGETHFLVLRQSGFQEKESFFELYRDKPTSDACGNTEVEPLASVHVDDTAGTPTEIYLSSSGIEVVYDPSGQEGPALKSLPVRAN